MRLISRNVDRRSTAAAIKYCVTYWGFKIWIVRQQEGRGHSRDIWEVIAAPSLRYQGELKEKVAFFYLAQYIGEVSACSDSAENLERVLLRDGPEEMEQFIVGRLEGLKLIVLSFEGTRMRLGRICRIVAFGRAFDAEPALGAFAVALQRISDQIRPAVGLGGHSTLDFRLRQASHAAVMFRLLRVRVEWVETGELEEGGGAEGAAASWARGRLARLAMLI